jgi:putative sterol carrier protein
VTDFDLSTVSAVEPAQFAQLVKSTPDSKIAEAMSGAQRTAILDEILGRFPALFRPDKAGSTNAVLQWDITGRPDGGVDTYQVIIENGACTTAPGADRDPRLTVTLGGVEFVKLVGGAANPMMMFMTGKLKAKGDLGLAANLANLFDLPKA